MNDINTHTEGIVMKRVLRMYRLRRLLHPAYLKLYALSALALLSTGLVSWSNIFANMPSPVEVATFYVFISNAILNTEAIVQVTVAVALLLALFLVRDALRGWGSVRTA